MYLVPFHVHALAAFSTALFFWWGFARVPGWQPRHWFVWGMCAGLMAIVYYVQAVLLIVVAWRLAARGSIWPIALTRCAVPAAIRC